MKAVVTGGAGFIGSHLAEALCRKGADIIIVDDLSLGDTENLGWVKGGDGVDFIHADAGNGTLMRELLTGRDVLFHFAGAPSVLHSIRNPLESNRRNLDVSLNVLLAARDAGVQRVIYASSSSVYGDGGSIRQHEAQPPSLNSPYALQKFTSETYAQLFYRLYDLPVVTLRYFNVIGPRQRADSIGSSVIANFCYAFATSRRPVIFGDGTQLRDFSFVSNIVGGTLAAATADAKVVSGEVFNCASGTARSLLDVVNELNGITNQDLTPVFRDRIPGDIQRSCADIRKIKQLLGYKEVVSWKDALRRTLDAQSAAIHLSVRK